jgi:hypothetical protein
MNILQDENLTATEYYNTQCSRIIKIKNKHRGFSQRANYINRATAACRRSYCQLLRRVSRGQRNGSPRPLISIF